MIKAGVTTREKRMNSNFSKTLAKKIDRVATALPLPFRVAVALVTLALYILTAVLFQAFFFALIIMVFLGFAGFGSYFLIHPQRPAGIARPWVLMPFVGLCLLCMAGPLAISAGFAIKSSLIVVVALAACLAVAAAIWRNAAVMHWLHETRRQFFGLSSYALLVLLPLLIMLLLPLMFRDYATSSYRTGPDLASYGKMAQYLIEGGSWPTRFNILDADLFLSLRDQSVLLVNDYADATMTWPFMFWYRWAVSSVQAYFFFITPARDIFQVAFLALLPSFLFVGGLAFLVLKELFFLPRSSAAMGACALLLNINLLNLWYEGFYGQSFATPFMLAFLLYCLRLRAIGLKRLPSPAPADERVPASPGVGWRTHIAGFAVLVCLLVSYPEGVVFFIALFLFVVAFIDLLWHRTVFWRTWAIVLGMTLACIVVLLPLGLLQEWFPLAVRQLKEAGGSGYEQPYWASLCEILGIDSIYRNVNEFYYLHVTRLRSMPNIWLNGLGTALVLGMVGHYHFARKKSHPDTVFWGASYVFLIFWMVTYPFITDNNYGFMKYYTLILPLIFIYLWASLGDASATDDPRRWQRLGRALHAGPFALLLRILLAATIFYSGASYIIDYRNGAWRITQSQMDLRQLTRLVDPAQTMILPTPLVMNGLLVRVQMIGAIVNVPWIVPMFWRTQSFFAQHNMEKKVAVLALKKEVPALPSNYVKLYENEDYVLLGTNKRVGSGLRPPGSTGAAKFSAVVFLSP